MNEAADTGSHFLTLAILVFYWALLSLWPQILHGNGKDTAGQKIEPPTGRTVPAQPIPALASMVDALRKVDRIFDEAAFMLRATQAYETILRAYADGNLKMLTLLVGPEVLEVFERAIAERRLTQETLGLTFVGMKAVSVTART
jgi:predicted lipid-binding transport protein (Tim44 family)